MTHPFFSELNETLICEHKTNSWNTDDTTPYHCHDGYEILVFIGGHASFFVENDGKILEPGDIVCCPPGAFHRAMPLQDKAYDRFLTIRKIEYRKYKSGLLFFSWACLASSAPSVTEYVPKNIILL